MTMQRMDWKLSNFLASFDWNSWHLLRIGVNEAHPINWTLVTQRQLDWMAMATEIPLVILCFVSEPREIRQMEIIVNHPWIQLCSSIEWYRSVSFFCVIKSDFVDENITIKEIWNFLYFRNLKAEADKIDECNQKWWSTAPMVADDKHSRSTDSGAQTELREKINQNLKWK